MVSLTSTVARIVDAAGGDRATAVATAVELVARARGLDLRLRVDDTEVRGADAGDVPGSLTRGRLGPYLPGLVLEAATGAEGRRRRGVHHTRPEVAAVVVDLAIATGAVPDGLIVDPACGGGAFLLAAAERMEGTRSAVLGRLRGCDVDPLATATTRVALALWADGRWPRDKAVVVADYLDGSPFGEAALVVGNPPFLGQLRRMTARDDAHRAAVRERWAGLGAYVDDAAAFLLAATESLAPDGTVALVQPVSVLSARDAEEVRARVAATVPPVAVWVPGERLFCAAVDTVALVCRADGRVGVSRRTGPTGTVADDVALPPSTSWAPLIADTLGTPTVAVDGPRLDSLASVVAGFRDQFYGLRAAVVEDPEGRRPLVTSGLIDPLVSRWGTRPCRYDRRRWVAPAVLAGRIDPSIERWVEDRRRPKLLVASQTRVIEAVVDPDGGWVPCTPVVSVEPHDPADLWHLAAVLTSPVATARLLHSAAGSGLSPDAVRVSAARLAALPLPAQGPAWDRAAEAARAAARAGGDRDAVVEVGAAAMAAYGIDDRELLGWWAALLPHRLTGPRSDAG